MALPINKLAPTAMVIAAVSCCAWPYVFSSDASGKKAATMPEIAPSQLSPRILPPPARNPFRQAGESVAQASKPTKTAPASTTRTQSTGHPGGNGAIASRSASPAGGKPRADPLSGLALIATSILADPENRVPQRLAVINGRIYAERERLKSKDPSAPPCVVARILSDRVLLECEGRTATLCYANVAAKAKAKHAGGMAEPSGGGVPSRPQSPADRDRDHGYTVPDIVPAQPPGPHNQPQL